MATRWEQLFSIRRLLDNPQPARPSFDLILRQDLSDELDILNKLNNSGKPWALLTTQLNYYPNGTGKFQLDMGPGKVLFVTRTTTNPYIPFLPVGVDELDDLQYGTYFQMYGGIYGQSWVLDQTIERISFYREGVTDQVQWCQIQPMPQESAVYTIYYLPSSPDADAALESATTLPEYSNLVTLRSATALLPYAQWFEDADANSNKRKELSMSFAYQLERKEQLFKDYIRQMTRPRTTTVADWNWMS